MPRVAHAQFGADEWTSGMSADVKWFVSLIMGNIGKLLVLNSLSSLAITSVEPTNDDTQ